MSRIPVLRLVLLVGCGRDGSGIAAVHEGLQSTVTLRRGETRPVSGTPLRLTFRDVTEDSRCPVDVVCVTAGDAGLDRLVASGGGASESVRLHLYREPRAVSHGGYTVTVVSLQPAPRAGRPIPPDQYRATLSVAAP